MIVPPSVSTEDAKKKFGEVSLKSPYRGILLDGRTVQSADSFSSIVLGQRVEAIPEIHQDIISKTTWNRSRSVLNTAVSYFERITP